MVGYYFWSYFYIHFYFLFYIFSLFIVIVLIFLSPQIYSHLSFILIPLQYYSSILLELFSADYSASYPLCSYFTLTAHPLRRDDQELTDIQMEHHFLSLNNLTIVYNNSDNGSGNDSNNDNNNCNNNNNNSKNNNNNSSNDNNKSNGKNSGNRDYISKQDRILRMLLLGGEICCN